jgi:hypothetical protein
MKNVKLKASLIFVAAMIFFYLLASFVALTFNVTHWDEGGRLAYALFAPTLSLVVAASCCDKNF